MRAFLRFALLTVCISNCFAQDSRNVEIGTPDTHFVLRRYSSRAEWEARKWHLRRQILSAAGLFPLPPRGPLNPRITDHTEYRGYVVETLLLETQPGYFLGGTLYRPAVSGKFPAVLLPHGHWKHGRFENRPSYSVPALGAHLALQGYVALAYDMVGYNDTRQTPHAFGGWREQLWSFNPLGFQLWNSMRALDYLATRRDVDPKRIGVTGASGGGTQTFLLTAVDDRVRVAAPVNMVSAHMQGGDPCEEAPNLRLQGANNVEFAAMAAPRQMLIVSCTHDWTRNTPLEEYPAIERIYELYKSGENVQNVHFEAEHNYNRESREAVYGFFGEALRPEFLHGKSYREESLPELDQVIQPVRHLAPVTLPSALNYEQLLEQWIAMSRYQADELRDTGAQRERLQFAIGAEWPSRVADLRSGEQVVLSRPGVGDRVPGIWLPAAGSPVVVINPDGSEAAKNSPAVQKLWREGHSLLLVDVFQTGKARVPRDAGGRWFHSYNQTDDANRVQDILTAVSFARSHKNGKVELLALNGAGVWCVFAAALAPIDLQLTANLNGFRGEDEDFHHRFFVPGVQRAGGLNAALKLVKNSHLTWN